MFGSLMKLAEDVVKIVAAPVEIAADVTRLATKPLADAMGDLANKVKKGVEDLTNG